MAFYTSQVRINDYVSTRELIARREVTLRAANDEGLAVEVTIQLVGP